MLRNLSTLLDKMTADAATRGDRPGRAARVAPLSGHVPALQQVQLACDFAKGASARLAGVAVPAFPDEEKTVDELKARIDKVVANSSTASRVRTWTPAPSAT